ncbi:MAG: hypothetical protein A2268_04975 [Candidatus Raymondbacteria bacterium RifOxyA12_full_50_37]|uniref:Aminomethyltransferase n=1 Tax=Candidatus Raymondbacteria bacterium RIFOXYD12_FULL_49_13 TaxID=1817890 RepID=A0A1F7FDS6_UNCRA|nr:MAG: hypothetical protein A2268_04975 [Candidatus Raymondbacteria bacterium RifOxyA12_full_50_37]OGJ94096.1 MAG: hypothetical protein A2248_12180 [Candidatus Raymondbacteria bacterium RIFOXYA2_FULL_49_16]OGJ96212.1 MAG: hypothetical protein A2350_17420 [Candidatus Raymondbacteria bacterium RifOxyB12_full_50_8]OGJ96921.1 MAG: hypothetical protein A2453_04780 [Candidatus Raymondbacteria bacterium RIFOXYC2_FULL_50_21]OGK04647.1 MAG: hypothetical protein A2519_20945 [Candidatus Raymondbacteria b
MKKTALYERHLSSKAKMAEFAGYLMPIQYTSIVEEHLQVRKKAGIFDVSHMGTLFVNGKEAKNFLQRIVTGNINALPKGKVLYTLMCTENGTAVDDLFVCSLEDTRYLMVVNASNVDKDLAWLNRFKPGEVQITNATPGNSIIAVQGPLAVGIMDSICSTPLSAQPSFSIRPNFVNGQPMLISRTGYTGEDGCEIYVANDHAAMVWDLLIEKGALPAGLGARDTLRLEMGYTLYGHEISDSTNVLEAGLGWIIDLASKDDFIGKAALVKSKEAGLQFKLVGLLAESKGIPRQGCPVVENEILIGHVTSGGYSPVLEKGIALAYVPLDKSVEGLNLSIDIRGRLLPVTVVKRKFLHGK